MGLVMGLVTGLIYIRDGLECAVFLTPCDGLECAVFLTPCDGLECAVFLTPCDGLECAVFLTPCDGLEYAVLGNLLELVCPPLVADEVLGLATKYVATPTPIINSTPNTIKPISIALRFLG